VDFRRHAVQVQLQGRSFGRDWHARLRVKTQYGARRSSRATPRPVETGRDRTGRTSSRPTAWEVSTRYAAAPTDWRAKRRIPARQTQSLVGTRMRMCSCLVPVPATGQNETFKNSPDLEADVREIQAEESYRTRRAFSAHIDLLGGVDRDVRRNLSRRRGRPRSYRASRVAGRRRFSVQLDQRRLVSPR
jgi:hypothetical protein